jgi:hypothetical protein
METTFAGTSNLPLPSFAGTGGLPHPSRSATETPDLFKNRIRHLLKPADIAEGEGPEEGIECGGRHHLMGQYLLRSPLGSIFA